MLNINNKNITEIRIGERVITSIYHGTKLVWSSPILVLDEVSKRIKSKEIIKEEEEIV